jgi:hypothetical protein
VHSRRCGAIPVEARPPPAPPFCGAVARSFPCAVARNLSAVLRDVGDGALGEGLKSLTCIKEGLWAFA